MIKYNINVVARQEEQEQKITETIRNKIFLNGAILQETKRQSKLKDNILTFIVLTDPTTIIEINRFLQTSEQVKKYLINREGSGNNEQ